MLKDTTSEIKVTFEELLGSKNGSITIDPSTLSRETATNIGSKAASSDGDEETLLDWWNGRLVRLVADDPAAPVIMRAWKDSGGTSAA